MGGPVEASSALGRLESLQSHFLGLFVDCQHDKNNHDSRSKGGGDNFDDLYTDGGVEGLQKDSF